MNRGLTHRLSAWAGLLGLSLALALGAGCDSKNKVESPAGGMILTLSSPTGSVAVNTPVLIEATAMNGTTPAAGESITFSVTPSGSGSFNPTAVTTGSDGVATTYYTGTISGTATLTATITGTATAANRGITVQSSSSGSSNITVTVNPTLLLANGIDTSTVAISVRDASNNPVANGTVVKIAAGERFVDVDGNGYWSNGIDSLVFDANGNGTWDAIGFVPSTATTSGGTGTATVDYISGSDAYTVYVKVTVNDNGITGASEISLQLTPNASIHSIYLGSDSVHLGVTETGAIETALLRATAFDINGNRVPEGLPISFIILDGPGGGEFIGPLGAAYGPVNATTNSQGVATVPIHSGTVAGTIRVRAYTPDALSNATQVLVSAGPPAYIVVGADKCNVDYWDNVASFNQVVAVVSDIYLNPVADSTAVYFTTDEGTMQSHLKRTEFLQGIARSNWISGNNVSTADGLVLVIAETAGGTVADTSAFYNTHVTSSIVVAGAPASIPADGASEAVVIVTGLDSNGLPVIGGTRFEGDATFLSVAGGTFENGCGMANARVKITSATLPFDGSTTGANDNGIGYVDLVQFWNGTASTSFTIQLTTGTAYSGNSSMTVPASASGGQVLDVSAMIKDRFSNPLGDHTLVLSASAGSVTGASQETNSYGEAVGFRWTAPPADTVAFSVTLTLTDTDPRGSGLVISKQVTVE